MPRRDRLMALAATAAVAVVLVLGYRLLGSWDYRRALRADVRRVDDLRSIVQAINSHHHGNAPPVALNLMFPANSPERLNLQDPLTQAPYEYLPNGGKDSSYQLCAIFAAESPSEAETEFSPPYSPFWKHPKGHYC